MKPVHDTMRTVKKSTYITPANQRLLAVVLLVIVGVGASGYLAYQNRVLTNHLAMVSEEFVTTEGILLSRQKELENTIAELSGNLKQTIEERDGLDENLREEKEKNEEFEEQIEDIVGTVGILDKLSKTDKELLQKYSRVYFLNEHYVPEQLKQIEREHLYIEERDQYLHAKVMPFFEEMVEDAKRDGIDLWVVSAFRSFDTQAQLKGQYTVTYGTGANTFSADQGYSEHQLGTTIDFTTRGINGGLEGFENTPAYEWLLDNAHKYGFVLSYPPNNAFYVFEPWHWRFVGEDLARDLNRDNTHFYDLDQRELNDYLISIFD